MPAENRSSHELLGRLAVVRRLCPEMRFGQLIATIGLLAEDETCHNLWDVEDEEFVVAVERFATDLSSREQALVQPADSSGEMRTQDLGESRDA